MQVRLYCEKDLEALRRMHANQGFDYAFPELGDPLFLLKQVMEDKRGDVVMGTLARLTCETYLLMDGDAGTALERYTWLKELNQVGADRLHECGLEDAHAWLPPAIARRFGKRLGALGWVRDDAWTPYCRRLT